MKRGEGRQGGSRPPLCSRDPGASGMSRLYVIKQEREREEREVGFLFTYHMSVLSDPALHQGLADCTLLVCLTVLGNSPLDSSLSDMTHDVLVSPTPLTTDTTGCSHLSNRHRPTYATSGWPHRCRDKSHHHNFKSHNLDTKSHNHAYFKSHKRLEWSPLSRRQFLI